MIIIIFSFTLLFSSNINKIDFTWYKLLHNTNNENKIISSEFFLSNIENPNPKEELEATLLLLRDKKIGKKIACNFPARYTYLKSKEFNIPSYNLSKCNTLQSFIGGFYKDKVSLVFTSEFVNSPASAFGHTMILFSDKNKPLEVSNTINFAAKTPSSDGFLTYTYKGLTGKYDGYFIQEPFFKKIYEYNILEQRYMYIYELNYTKKQIINLLYHLFELRKATFKYYFLDDNCASQTTDLLNTVNFNIKSDKAYYLPFETIQSIKPNIVDMQRFIPLVNKIDLLLRKMTKEQKNIFKSLIKNNGNLSENSDDIIKEAMNEYTTFNFRRFHKVFKNYDNIISQSYTKQVIDDNSSDPLNKTKPSNLLLGYLNQKNNDYLYFGFRPLFIDKYDIQFNSIQQSEVSLLNFEFIARDNHVKILKGDILNMKSFPSSLIFYKPFSWEIYSGVNRKNRSNKLQLSNYFSIGKTFNIVDNISYTMLLSLGLDNFNVFTKGKINFNYNFSKKLKFGMSSSYKQEFSKYYSENEAFISIKRNDFLYGAKIINSTSKIDNKYFLSFKYNF